MSDSAIEPRRLLVLRFHALGDVALATGIVRALALGHGLGGPAAEVEVATETPYLPLFRGLPEVSRLWDREELERASDATGLTSGAGAARAPRRFDHVVDLQGTPGSRRLADRWGPSSTVRTRSALRRWIVLWGDRFPRPNIPHAIARYAEAAGLDAATTSLRPVAAVTPEEDQQAAALAPAAFALPRGRAVALLSGASRRTKEYPREQLLEVERLLEKRGCPVWWVEPPSAASELPETAKSASGAGHPIRLSLGPLKALLSRAAVVVANDSGPMHLATALGTPVLGLFGSTVERFGFGPAGEFDRILEVDDLACRPCGVHGRSRCWLGHWRCLRDLDPIQVAEEAQQMLQESLARGGADHGTQARANPSPIGVSPVGLERLREA